MNGEYWKLRFTFYFNYMDVSLHFSSTCLPVTEEARVSDFLELELQAVVNSAVGTRVPGPLGSAWSALLGFKKQFSFAHLVAQT